MVLEDLLGALAHTAVAVGVQLVAGHLAQNWLVPGLVLSALYMGREHAQAEYRWIEHYGSGLRANMPWYGGFTPRAWTAKAMLDWVLPLAATTAVTLLLH
jgi:hypothetical protein